MLVCGGVVVSALDFKSKGLKVVQWPFPAVVLFPLACSRLRDTAPFFPQAPARLFCSRSPSVHANPTI